MLRFLYSIGHMEIIKIRRIRFGASISVLIRLLYLAIS